MTIEQQNKMYRCIKEIEDYCRNTYMPKLKQFCEGTDDTCEISSTIDDYCIKVNANGIRFYCDNNQYNLNYEAFNSNNSKDESIYNTDYHNSGPMELVRKWQELKPELERQIKELHKRFLAIQRVLDNFKV